MDNGKIKPFGEVLIISTGLSAFSFFISCSYPVRLLAFIFLIFSVFRIARSLPFTKPFYLLTGRIVSLKYLFFGILGGVMAGLLLAYLCRYRFNVHLYPKSTGSFFYIAALIGITEELVFRGYIQGYLSTNSKWLAIIIASLSHTSYKCCLFCSNQSLHPVNIAQLAVYTFIGGLLFGILKEYFRSTIPPAIAHAVFDIIVYAEYTQAPWWVW
jgi:membrane protease YdiL (CAAX protease family)